MTQSELSHMAGAVDDSTINIVLGIFIIIIIIIIIVVPYKETRIAEYSG